MKLDIAIEQEILEVEKQIKALKEEEQTLSVLDKINRLNDKLASLIKKRDEQLNNVLDTAKEIMTNNDKLFSETKVYMNRISEKYHEIESGKYSQMYVSRLEKEVDKILNEMFDVHKQIIDDKQKELNRLYRRYRTALTTLVKDVTTTEAFILKEEIDVMSDQELKEFHANNRAHEVIRRLAEVEMKRRNLNELPDISPVAAIVEKWANSINAEYYKRSKSGITYFRATENGVEPAGVTRSDIKRYVRKANQNVKQVAYVRLKDLLDETEARLMKEREKFAWKDELTEETQVQVEVEDNNVIK